MTDREIYAEVRDALMRFASSLVGWQDAADLVSEVMVATLQRCSLSSLDDPRAYLMRSLLNRARSRARRQIRERHALARMDPVSTVDQPDTASSVDLARAVADLPVRQRAAVFLVYWEDLAPIEAAHLIGVRPGTLRRYLHDARKRLEVVVDE